MDRPEAPAGYEAHAAIALICEEHRFLRRQFDTLQCRFGDGRRACGNRRSREEVYVDYC